MVEIFNDLIMDGFCGPSDRFGPDVVNEYQTFLSLLIYNNAGASNTYASVVVTSN